MRPVLMAALREQVMTLQRSFPRLRRVVYLGYSLLCVVVPLALGGTQWSWSKSKVQTQEYHVKLQPINCSYMYQV